MSDRVKTFRARLSANASLLGTFIKSPGVHGIEVLSAAGLDFVVIDSEHAPWDRAAIDLAVLAARANDTPSLVRVPNLGDVLTALDCGATGVMIPHVADVEFAKRAVAACRYRGGNRGFTNSSRAGGYGALGIAEHVRTHDEQVAVVAMLEDPHALDSIDELVKVEGIDAFFLGRGDLAVALGETSMDSPVLQKAVQRLTTAVIAAGKPLCAFVGKVTDIPPLQSIGVSSFILSSDQGLLRVAANSELQQFRKLKS